ncbi:hypothetical protein WSM22_36010 [Cytophagales bacterium WSM2-2]|nr:hypothetical protein WSM22_36010 [Cytophagales bacterium WSM2-2]
MKKILILICLGLCLKANASHIAGGEFRRTHIVGFQFRFDLTLYFDLVNGNPGARDQVVNARIYRNSDNGVVMDVLMALASESQVNYIQSACGNFVKLSELVYSATVNLQPDIFNDPAGYYIVWERCCRNYQITNIYSGDPNSGAQAAGQTFFLQFPAVFLDNKLFVNSSPKFSKPFADYTCVGYPYFSDFSAQDEDGDSLVYSVTDPFSTHTTDPLPVGGPKPYPPVTWRPPFSLQNVMGINSNFSIDSHGIITVTPSQQGLFSFAIRCEEFRNGNKIGEVRREFQILAVDCPVQTAPVVSGRVNGGMYSDLPLSVHFDSSVADGDRCVQVKVSDVDVAKSAQDIRISAIPLNFDSNISGVLPSTIKATLTQNSPFAEFSICFSKCPPTVSNTFQIGIVAYDASCAVPLTDTLRINITIDVPPGACQHQNIRFSKVDDKNVALGQFSLNASTSSGLPVSYSSPDSSVIKLSTSVVSMLRPGLVAVTATQIGDQTHLPANPVSRKFCVNPEPPVLSISATAGSQAVIQSSSTNGNLWYKDGAFQSGLNGSFIPLTSEGGGHRYTVRLMVENCISEESKPVVILGIQDEEIQIFPNPVTNSLYINFPGSESVKNVSIFSMTGQIVHESEISNENAFVDMNGLNPGLYLLRVKDSSKVVVRKIYKK